MVQRAAKNGTNAEHQRVAKYSAMRPLSFHTLPLSLACALVPALAPSLAQAAGWEPNIAYGGNMSADLYVPASPADPAALVISLHFCGGNKGNAQQWFKSYADSMGFYIITPQSAGGCFDATAAKGGERGEIVAMVDWAIAEHGVDPRLVFAAGASSGACMTQALLAAYPDVFAAGSSLAGVPAGAWTGGGEYGYSTPSQSDQAWGDKVRALNPSYMGPWPRMQIWHGGADSNLKFTENWPAETGQWRNVWGFMEADGTAESIKPAGAQDTWSRVSYVASNDVLGVETNTVAGVEHDLTGRGLWGDVVRFFAPDTLPPDPEPGTGGTTGAGGSGAGTGGAVGVGGSGTGTGGAGVGTGGSGTGGPGAGGGANVGAGGAGAGGSAVGAGGALTGAGGTSTSSGGTATDPGPGGASGGCSFGGADRSSSIWGAVVALAVGLTLRRRRQPS